MIEKDPLQITTEGDSSYPRAIQELLGPKVKHRCNAYLNRWIKQDHRGIKQRYYPMLGFGSLASGRRFCRALEELKQYFGHVARENNSYRLPNNDASSFSER